MIYTPTLTVSGLFLAETVEVNRNKVGSKNKMTLIFIKGLGWANQK
jgi:hypothetical protein